MARALPLQVRDCGFPTDGDQRPEIEIVKNPTHAEREPKDPGPDSPPLDTGGVREPRPLPSSERDFRRVLRRRLENLHLEVESLRRTVSRLPRESRTEYLVLLEALQTDAQRLERRMRRFDSSGYQTWRTFRSSGEETWTALKRSLLSIAMSIRRNHPESAPGPKGPRAKR